MVENETDEAPAGTATLCGTAATPGLELVNVIEVPAAALPVSDTVVVKLLPPATEMVGWSREAIAAGITVTVTVLVTPPELRLRVTVLDVATGLVGMLTVPVDCPAAIETLAGAGTAAGFALPIVTVAPPAAGPVRENCNDTAVPPVTVEDAGVTEARAGWFAGFTVTVTVLVRHRS